MTTLVALATKDALVMGCDSLGTVTKKLVDPFDLVDEFFDVGSDWKLKTNERGNPVLKDFSDIFKKAQNVPFNQMTHVGKLFSLRDLPMGVMATGIASIGNATIKSLINEFKTGIKSLIETDYTVKSCAEKLLEFIQEKYQSEYSEYKSKPELDFMIGGYDKQKRVPSIYRILVHNNKIEAPFPEENPFGIAFGGQMQEIQRIVFGIDTLNRVKLIYRTNLLMNRYRDLMQQFLKEKKILEELPGIETFGKDLSLFEGWDLDAFDADWGDFSEQNAIECVNFFVEIMIKSQQFSSRLPTVGGDVHMGLITKDKGFIFISKEEYVHEGHITPMED